MYSDLPFAPKWSSGSEFQFQNNIIFQQHLMFYLWLDFWIFCLPQCCLFSAVFAGSMNPLCVLQLDDPPQRFNTSVLKNTTNPAWDQPFILWVIPKSCTNYHSCKHDVCSNFLFDPLTFVMLFFFFPISELNGLSKELNIQLTNDGQPQESKEIINCLFMFFLWRQLFFHWLWLSQVLLRTG